ncbi:MAG: nucleotidyltransferase domain-containing protein [Thermoproteales archaeon]|nr:nucleotidyltransferase domain-containing protein [Thermoproteales archaeon]
MSRSYEDTLLEYLQNYMKIARKVKEIVKKVDPNARVYVFGSVVKGKYTAASDIDILVVTEKIKEKHRMMVEVYKETKAPVELHIATPEKFTSWYRRFIKNEEIIEVA